MSFQCTYCALDDLVCRLLLEKKKRNGIARAVDATLSPIDQWQEFNLLAVEEFKDVLARIFAIQLGPAAGPFILGIVVGYSLPIAPPQLRRVLDLEAALVGRINHVHSTK